MPSAIRLEHLEASALSFWREQMDTQRRRWRGRGAFPIRRRSAGMENWSQPEVQRGPAHLLPHVSCN